MACFISVLPSDEPFSYSTQEFLHDPAAWLNGCSRKSELCKRDRPHLFQLGLFASLGCLKSAPPAWCRDLETKQSLRVTAADMDQLVLVVERQNVTRLVMNGVCHHPRHGDEFTHPEKENEAQNQFTDTMIHEPKRHGCIHYYNHVVKMSPWVREEMSTEQANSNAEMFFLLSSFFFTIIKQSNTNMSVSR